MKATSGWRTAAGADRHITSGGEGIWARDGVISSAQVRQKRLVEYIPNAQAFKRK